MKQPTICAFLGHTDAQIARAEDGVLEVWDLFAGAGGFTTGAKLAGCNVVYACDAWPEALETYQRNHPNTRTQCLELPATIPFPADGRPYHVHGSPPCQRFTDMGRTHNTSESLEHAQDLLEWFLDTALTCGATSWSMEQVSRPETRAAVEAARRRFPDRVAYATVDFYELGVPQHRKRLIAGSPVLVALLVRACSAARRRSVKDTIPNPQGTMLRNSKNWTRKRPRHTQKPGESKYVYTKASTNDNLYPLTGPSPTVVCSGDVRWWWRQLNGQTKCTKLSVVDTALLQTFPVTYEWPSDVQLARKLVGNAVPPLVSQLLLSRHAI